MSLLALLLACASTPVESRAGPALTLSLAEHVPNVVRVSWDPTGDGATGVLRHRLPGEPWTEVPADPAAGEALVLGLPLDADVEVELDVEAGGELATSPTASITTGPLPTELPGLHVDLAQEGALDGGLLLTTNVQSPPAVIVFDGAGQVVWVRVLDGTSWAGRARPSPDGQHIIVMPVGNDEDPQHELKVLALDGELVETITINEAHHDFTVLDDGTLVTLVYETLDDSPWGPIRADALVERAPDGTQQKVWSAFDSFAYTPEADVLDGDGWTHGNSIEYDPAQDRYLVSFLGLGGIGAIDRSSGELDWFFGGHYSDFVDQDGGVDLLYFQHGFQLLDTGLLVFENGPSSRASSGAVEFAFTEGRPVAQEVWRYQADPGVYTPSLGSVHRLDSGDTIVDFATGGRLAQVSPEGEVRWQISSDLGGAFGYAVWLPGLGPQD